MHPSYQKIFVKSTNVNEFIPKIKSSDVFESYFNSKNQSRVAQVSILNVEEIDPYLQTNDVEIVETLESSRSLLPQVSLNIKSSNKKVSLKTKYATIKRKSIK